MKTRVSLKYFVNECEIISCQSNNTAFATTDYSHRCIKERLGGLLLGSVSGGRMEQTGVTYTYKHSETVHLTFTKSFQNKFFYVQMDDTVALTYLVKMGGTTSQEETNFEKEIWIILCPRKPLQLKHSVCRGLST